MSPPSIVADPEPSPPLAAALDAVVESLARPAAADGDVETPPQPAARAGADRPWLRPVRITMRSLRHALNGMARAGEILGGAYRRSSVACYVSKSSALCVRCYQRSFVPGYVAKASALCASSWGVAFNPLPPGSQLLPVSDPSLVIERFCFTPDMERIHLLVLTVFVGGAVLFVSLEVIVVAGVIDRYDQYYAILKLVFTILQRLLVAYSKACDFYTNVEWIRTEMPRERQQPPPFVLGEQQQLPPPLPPELDLC